MSYKITKKQTIVAVVLVIGIYLLIDTDTFQKLLFPQDYWSSQVKSLEAQQKLSFETLSGVQEDIRVLRNKWNLGIITRAEYEQEYNVSKQMFDTYLPAYNKISADLSEAKAQLAKFR